MRVLYGASSVSEGADDARHTSPEAGSRNGYLEQVFTEPGTVWILLSRWQAAKGMREKWVELLPPGRPHDVAAIRAREIGILEAFAGKDADAPLDLLAPDSWPNWLQLRLATSVNVKFVLDLLVREGRTKRIRASASEHLRHA